MPILQASNKVILKDIRAENYGAFIAPFLSNGIIVDTCVLYELVDGLIEERITGNRLDALSEFKQICAVFDLIHVTDRWNKLYVTPHILTEICRHLENKYNGRVDYHRVVSEIFPILDGMNEYAVSKTDFCKQIDLNKPVIEAGDLSIFVKAEDFSSKKEKIAILTKDGGILSKFESYPYILAMDYRAIAFNMV